MMPAGPDRSARDADRRMELAREWDDLVDQVRRLDGFEDFLRPPRLASLLPAAADGPVVILNVSRWRCDALIVRSEGVEVVDLPDLTREIVEDRVDAYLRAVGARQENTLRVAGQTRDLGTGTPGDDPDDVLHDCLRWMWEAFAERILNRLGHTGAPAGDTWPRVWWCPTGPLTLLPIHAAGRRHDGTGAAVLDRVVSSYTPTLRALVEARAGAGVREPAPARMLFVGMPETEGLRGLPNVRVEERMIGQLFGSRRTPLVGSEATRDAVLAALPEHRWVHFACHGEQDLADPARGGLLLHDGRLDVTDLSAREYHGEFAYLSGCKTAVGGERLPDEAITLAAALHYTGYRHVVATLWSVFDRQAATVAAEVYQDLVHDRTLVADGAAVALHRAVRRLRATCPDRPGVWMPFAHTGP